MPSINIIAQNYDIPALLASAGQPDNTQAVYNSKLNILAVQGVTQSALDAAFVAATPLDMLSISKTNNKTKIDSTAEQARRRYITVGDGQSMIYQEKSEEATDYIAAGYPVDLTPYPLIQAEATAMGISSTIAADTIISQKSMWVGIGSTIELIRLTGKKAITDATTQLEIDSAVTTAIDSLLLV